MSDYEYRHKRPYRYNTKTTRNGTDVKIKKMRNRGLSFSQIAQQLHMTRQQAFQIYSKTVAK